MSRLKLLRGVWWAVDQVEDALWDAVTVWLMILWVALRATLVVGLGAAVWLVGGLVW